jgi:DNA-binding Lrp family transcriptional regulator
MVTAYILIQTEVGKAAQVAKDIIDITGVQQAQAVTGPYDVIVRAEARNIDELGQLVVAARAGRGWHHQDPHLPGGTPLALLDHRLVSGRHQQRQQYRRLVPVGGERLRQRAR